MLRAPDVARPPATLTSVRRTGRHADRQDHTAGAAPVGRARPASGRGKIRILATSLALLATPAQPDASIRFVAEARAACHAPPGAKADLPGIAIRSEEAGPNDLPKLRITDERSGGWMLVFYDPASASTARSRAACLGAQLRLLGDELSQVPPDAQWHSVVFTTAADYAAPAGQSAARWTIPVRTDGTLGAEGSRMLLLTMPHEQVHRFQRFSGSHPPRWFEEGEAEWVSRRVKRALAPAEAANEAARYAAALARSTTPTSLSRWGGMQVTRAAIMRQLPPEERRRMEADPSYAPDTAHASFRFGPGDMESDEGNTEARYEAATRVFEDMEARRGFGPTRDWANGITSRSGPISTRAIAEDAAARLHYDLAAGLDATDRPTGPKPAARNSD